VRGWSKQPGYAMIFTQALEIIALNKILFQPATWLKRFTGFIKLLMLVFSHFNGSPTPGI
jgi:hypothetical protein